MLAELQPVIYIEVPAILLELNERHLRLELTTCDIVDVEAYAEAWNKLGADFEAIGFHCNAEQCWQHWKHYQAAA